MDAHHIRSLTSNNHTLLLDRGVQPQLHQLYEGLRAHLTPLVRRTAKAASDWHHYPSNRARAEYTLRPTHLPLPARNRTLNELEVCKPTQINRQRGIGNSPTTNAYRPKTWEFNVDKKKEKPKVHPRENNKRDLQKPTRTPTKL